ncbi:MAG: hypothetical protein WB556_20480 [Candidatus Acidiferrum sp.]
MRFERGTHYPHPPRGRGRKPYTMSDAALRQRCHNLRRTRLRSDWESLTIKLLIWQSCFESGPRQSQRVIGRQVGVWPSYVCKVQKQAASVGWDTRVQYGRRVTLDDLAEAQRFTARFREQEPGLLAQPPIRRLCAGEPRVMTADECIAERTRFAEEWKRKNPGYGGSRGGWFRW